MKERNRGGKNDLIARIRVRRKNFFHFIFGDFNANESSSAQMTFSILLQFFQKAFFLNSPYFFAPSRACSPYAYCALQSLRRNTISLSFFFFLSPSLSLFHSFFLFLFLSLALSLCHSFFHSLLSFSSSFFLSLSHPLSFSLFLILFLSLSFSSSFSLFLSFPRFSLFLCNNPLS